jgi:hypothetical protein
MEDGRNNFDYISEICGNQLRKRNCKDNSSQENNSMLTRGPDGCAARFVLPFTINNRFRLHGNMVKINFMENCV